jgi:hypothetical protein
VVIAGDPRDILYPPEVVAIFNAVKELVHDFPIREG